MTLTQPLDLLISAGPSGLPAPQAHLWSLPTILTLH